MNIKLNKDLLKKQNIDESTEKFILYLHSVRLNIEAEMEKTDDIELLRSLDRFYTGLETRLQIAWGFPENPNWHKFWNRPKCTCPRMDNEDAYPTGYCVVNQECPLHGK